MTRPEWTPTRSRTPLHDGWTLRAAPGPQVPAAVAGRSVPATVPGCVHTDLLAAGLIPDPYADDNERAVAWIGWTDWIYRTTFTHPPAEAGEPEHGPAERIDLVCEGLDTVATVALNGATLGGTANMHRSHRFDVGPLLRAGPNELEIRFTSAYRHAVRERERLGERPNAYPEPFNFIRKMACNFGWDWGPTLVTAGIWQPIGLHAWSDARLARVRPQVTVTGDRGRVELHVDVERAGVDPSGPEPLRVTAGVGGVTVQRVLPADGTVAVLVLEVPQVRRWWPRGYGDQPRYPLEVTLARADGTPLDTWRRRIGFRSVELDTRPDEHGSAFTLVVNDQPVFVRGANWIPDDAFPHRVTRQRYAERLGAAVDANLNLLRVWGGGRYESEDFHDLADELGLLVQHDFLFACAAYPEEEPLRSEVAAEAREQVVRLASHPSLVLWTGNNENIWGFHDWDWQEPLAGRSWGAGYYHELLPGIVAELDPTRPYWPGSPWSGRHDRHPNDPAHGSTHIWDVWNTHDYLRYRDWRPRFVAEFGYQGPPAYATLRRALRDEPLAPDSPGMRHHQKAIDGDRKLRRGLEAHLPAPVDFDDWHWLTQLNQARAVALGVEHFRSLRPLCTGTIVWQLNDCWPVTSWSMLDGDGRRKPLWYALRRAYADRLLTVQPRDGGLALIAVNDTGDPWHAPVRLSRLTLAGQPCARRMVELVVGPYASVELLLPAELARPDDPLAELLLAEPLKESGEAEPPARSDGSGRLGRPGDVARAFWFFAEDRDVRWPAADWDAGVERTATGLLVRVTARTVLRDLTLFPDRLDPAAVVDEALVTLLPGETATFTVHNAPYDPEALTTRPVLRCVNDLT